MFRFGGIFFIYIYLIEVFIANNFLNSLFLFKSRRDCVLTSMFVEFYQKTTVFLLFGVCLCFFKLSALSSNKGISGYNFGRGQNSSTS